MAAILHPMSMMPFKPGETAEPVAQSPEVASSDSQAVRSRRPSAIVDDADNAEREGSLIFKTASKLQVPIDVVRAAHNIFKECATKSNGGDVTLDKDGFAKVLCRITDSPTVDDLPSGLLFDTFAVADKSGDDGIDFAEFATWYARHGFSEDVLLTKDQREIRKVARKYGLAHSEVERYKRTFDRVDLNRSGVIEYEEFRKLLSQLLKIPEHLELPNSRVRQFWLNTNTNGNDTIEFEEFVVFYTKYFDSTSSDVSPLVDFYRGFRPNAMRTG